MKEIIAVDADDTLFDENNAIRKFINENYGYAHTEADYLVSGEFNRYWERIWDVSDAEGQEMYEAFLSSPFKSNMKPIEGAIPAVQKLKQRYDLVVVTSRGQQFVDMTHETLAEHYPSSFGDVHFVPLWGNGEKVTKAKICNEIGAQYLVDDAFEHCKFAAEVGIKAVLFGDYGWSREQELPTNAVRCKDWGAVTHLLLES